MTIGKKLAAGVTLALSALVLIGGVSYWSTSRLIENNSWVEHTHKVLTGLESLFSLLKDVERGQRGFIMSGKESFLQPYTDARTSIDKNLSELRQLTQDNDNQRRALDELKPLMDRRIEVAEKSIQLRRKDKEGNQGEGFRQAVQLIEEGEGLRLMVKIREIIERMKDEEGRLLVERNVQAEASGRATLWTAALGTPLMGLLVFVGGFLIARSIINPVREAVARLASTSAELLAGTVQQAAGTQEQAAAVAQTVTSVDEVTQTSEQAAQRARGVSEAMKRNLEIGKAGRKASEESLVAKRRVQEQVESTAENILALAEQAQAIGEIIATVNDIAEQTNLLALNAAIEASRAGEHGRGFAVVAGEVKALADQSKKATVQVRQILGEIQKATNKTVLSTEEVTRGVASAIKLSTQADETIAALADTLEETARSAGQIVASAGQQATGMAQIHQAMKNIDQVSRQNLTATRQAEQAAQNLNELGAQLAALLSK
jgi:methyl-accepting chemotaxis protein